MPPEQMHDLSSEYPIMKDHFEAYQRGGHILLRGIASAEEVRAYRPLVTSIVDEVARTRDKQGRISDYSAMFTQVTNVWRMSEAAGASSLHNDSPRLPQT